MLGAGTWKNIHWYAGPELVTCTEAEEPVLDEPTCPALSVFGWSKGYVAFADNKVSIAVWTSADGFNWTKRKNLNLGGLEYLKVAELVEGPTGLLAIGRFSVQGTCAPPDFRIHAIWRSVDGISWSLVPDSAIDGTPTAVSASSRGYIASGDAGEPVVWISGDGLTWTRSKLPFAIYRSATLDGPLAFVGGFIVYGSIVEPGGCGGDSYVTSAVWFSATGHEGWTRAVLPGAGRGADVSTWVARLNDSTLIAGQSVYDTPGYLVSEAMWISSDALTWTEFSSPALKGKMWNLLGDGQRTLVIIDPPQMDLSDEYAEPEPPTWMMFDDHLAVVAVPQSGDIPAMEMWEANYSLGPTGLVFSDGTQVWFGQATLD